MDATGSVWELRRRAMNDLQAFKVINGLMPGGRRTMPFKGPFFDRYLMFYHDGRKVDVFRDAVTGLVTIVNDGQRIGDPQWN
jgi:hypothetical protein